MKEALTLNVPLEIAKVNGVKSTKPSKTKAAVSSIQLELQKKQQQSSSQTPTEDIDTEDDIIEEEVEMLNLISPA